VRAQMDPNALANRVESESLRVLKPVAFAA